MAEQWANWKDHFFYAVAPSFAPTATTPTNCGSCLTVNGAGQYIAIILYAERRLSGQIRRAPPLDADTKQLPVNYLEGANAGAVPGTGLDFASGPATAAFNDRLFCVDPSLNAKFDQMMAG